MVGSDPAAVASVAASTAQVPPPHLCDSVNSSTRTAASAGALNADLSVRSSSSFRSVSSAAAPAPLSPAQRQPRQPSPPLIQPQPLLGKTVISASMSMSAPTSPRHGVSPTTAPPAVVYHEHPIGASPVPSVISPVPSMHGPALTAPSSAGSTAFSHQQHSPRGNKGNPPQELPSWQQLPPPPIPVLDRSAAVGPQQQQRQRTSSVTLGVDVLERQQAEVERRRAEEAAATAVSANQAAVAAQALAAQQQAEARRASEAARLAQAAEQLRQLQPSATTNGRRQAPYPHYDDDQDTAPSSDMTGSGQNNVDHPGIVVDKPTIGRSSSFGRFLRTPLKHTHKLRHSFSMDRSQHNENDSYAANKHMRSVSVPPSAADGSAQGGTVALSPMHDEGDDENEEMWQGQVKPLVYGYLYKLGRNGQWQRRFFETDGESLTYYKSRKRLKLLASLDLCKVGTIAVNQKDPTGCQFTIEVADRLYFLQAENKAKCKDWVINLNRVREARLQVGGFKLVDPEFRHDHYPYVTEGDRNRSESDEYAARVVMVANRERTRATFYSDAESMFKDIKDLERVVSSENLSPRDGAPPANGRYDVDSATGAGGHTPFVSPTGSSVSAPATFAGFPQGGHVAPYDQIQEYHPGRSPRMIAQLPPEVLARWQKRRSNFTQMSLRLVRWARRMKMLRCKAREEDVIHSYAPRGPHGSYGFYPSTEMGDLDDIPETREISGVMQHGHTSGEGEYYGSSIPRSRSFDGGHSEWIVKETDLHMQSRARALSDTDDHADMDAPDAIQRGGLSSGRASPTMDNYDDDVEPRQIS